MTLSKEALIGAWRLVSAIEIFADGERQPEFGGRAGGYLCYSPEGIVSAVLGDMTRPVSAATDPQTASDDEIVGMSRHFIAYAGPFTVDPDNDIVQHHIEVALFADWQGGDQERHVVIRDGRLHIIGSPRMAADGRIFHSELVWERATPRPEH